jgi:hypothetical protein
LNSQRTEIHGIKINNAHLFELDNWLNVDINNDSFYNISVGLNNIDLVFIQNSDNVKISDILFLNFKLVAMQIVNSNATMLNTTFQNLTKGMIIQDNSYVIIANSSFVNLDSHDIFGFKEGSGILIQNSQVEINHTEFTNNTAENKGGAIFYGYDRPKFMNLTFSNNIAKYGNNIGSYPIEIKIENSELSELIFKGVASGQAIQDSIEFGLYDYDHQLTTFESGTNIVIVSKNVEKAQVHGGNNKIIREGVSKFDNIIFKVIHGFGKHEYTIVTKSIDEMKYFTVFQNNYTSPIIQVYFRNWTNGEILSNNECKIWEYGSYSLGINQNTWLAWMDNAKWHDKNEIFVDEGYWRLSLNSTKIVKCLNEKAWL